MALGHVTLVSLHGLTVSIVPEEGCTARVTIDQDQDEHSPVGSHCDVFGGYEHYIYDVHNSHLA